MEENEIYENLVKILKNHSDVDNVSYSLDTDIVQDLGIYGDAASEMLLDIKISFSISWDNFVFDKYFPDEVISDMFFMQLSMARPKNWFTKLVHQYDWCFYKFLYCKKSYSKLTCRDLVSAIRRGSL